MSLSKGLLPSPPPIPGNFGKPGTGGYPLRGHNNVQGCSDFGSINTFFPGYQPGKVKGLMS